MLRLVVFAEAVWAVAALLCLWLLGGQVARVTCPVGAYPNCPVVVVVAIYPPSFWLGLAVMTLVVVPGIAVLVARRRAPTA